MLLGRRPLQSGLRLSKFQNFLCTKLGTTEFVKFGPLPVYWQQTPTGNIKFFNSIKAKLCHKRRPEMKNQTWSLLNEEYLHPHMKSKRVLHVIFFISSPFFYLTFLVMPKIDDFSVWGKQSGSCDPQIRIISPYYHRIITISCCRLLNRFPQPVKIRQLSGNMQFFIYCIWSSGNPFFLTFYAF